MIHLTLQAHAEKLAPGHPIAGNFAERPLLYHQVRTYAALEQSSLVMNTYPTGTGKTIAALLWLLHPALRTSPHSNTLLVAPTNALVDQHASDVARFADQHALDIAVFQLNAALIDRIENKLHLRRGERLQRFLEDPWTFYAELGIAADAERKPYVVVTNPDIFYLALYFQYGRLDKRNVFGQFFLGSIRYVIIDEFHYYDAKQFANFLFFFTFWRDWQKLNEGSKICLLSATPTSHVYTYLDRIFGADGWERVGPDNEPSASAQLPTVPVLAPLEVTITTGQIQEWVEHNQSTVLEWHAQDLDCVIISSSLSQINRIYASLRTINPTRITGPEDRRERTREAATILATPTVDIGYNFGRSGKDRQSIDRLICDARFGDELTQRIGRAGRVLGRETTDQPSQAVLVLSDAAWAELQPLDQRSLSRAEWARVVDQLQALPDKHRMDSYIRTFAIGESFYPILHIHDAGGGTYAEALFEHVRAVFAPASRVTWKSLAWAVKTLQKREIWLQSSAQERWGPGAMEHVRQYLRWYTRQMLGIEENSPAQAAAYKKRVERIPSEQQKIEAFIRAQVAISKAVFHFREAWQGPQAMIYDPGTLFSSSPGNRYDLLHLLAHYEYRIIDQNYFAQQSALEAKGASIYLELLGHRLPRLIITFTYRVELDQEEFEKLYCSGVVALEGLRLRAHEQGTRSSVNFDHRIAAVIENTVIPCLVVPPDLSGALIAVIRGTPFFSRECVVTFGNGNSATYLLVPGTAALHIVADYSQLVRRINAKRQRVSDEPIFC